MDGVTPEDRAAKRLRDDLPLYSAECLKIRTKEHGIQPLRLSATQRHVHAAAEDQLRRTSMVRLIVLKGRQTFITTYTAARHYHKITHRHGVRGFVLAHLEEATSNIFGMVRFFHEQCPDELRPQTGAESAKELLFSGLASGVKMGTAGSKAVGRSEALQYFHGSEVAFWDNAEDHSAGIFQAVARVPKSEIILESTANGIGNAFHRLWKAAEAGNSEFECCFIPWFIHEEYTAKPPEGWHPPEAFREYGEVYNLTPGQLYWAWLKNRDASVIAGGGPDEFNWKFRQEYPANADEAFQTSGANHFIRPEVVLKARKSKVSGSGPVVLGVDPSRGGSDMMGIIDRQRRRLGGHVCERYKTSRDQRANAGYIVQIVKKLRSQGVPLRKVCIDCTDGGALYDHVLDALGDDLVVGVNFGERAHDPEHYANRRAEMHDRMRLWFDDQAGVNVPDRDDLQGDLCAYTWGFGNDFVHTRPNGQLVMAPKERIREKIGFSPDLGDAAALTFAIDYSELVEAQDSARSGNNLGAAGWLV